MIKEEVGPLKDLQGLPDDEKRDCIVQGFKWAFAVSPCIEEEDLPGFYILAEQIGDILLNYGKENDESGKKK